MLEDLTCATEMATAAFLNKFSIQLRVNGWIHC